MLKETKESSRTFLPSKLISGLQALREGYWYSQDVECDRWEFAISIQRLEQLGLNKSDLRWLVMKGMIEHGSEITVLGDDGRQFRATGNLTFCEGTCVVLTDQGAADVGELVDPPPSLTEKTIELTAIGQLNEPTQPAWNALSRRLSLNGSLIKRFKWPASNQEAVLCVFQEEGWPERIDDPLSPQADQDPKRRLADTIKCLNRKQANALIHFRGDGTGQGVLWERVED